MTKERGTTAGRRAEAQGAAVIFEFIFVIFVSRSGAEWHQTQTKIFSAITDAKRVRKMPVAATQEATLPSHLTLIVLSFQQGRERARGRIDGEERAHRRGCCPVA